MNRKSKCQMKRCFSAILALLLIYCCASPAFSISPLNGADFATKDLTTGEVTYLKASDLPTTRSSATVVPAYEGPESAPSSIMPRDIIGGDNRTKISDTTVFPYRAIGHIDVKWPNGASTIGTAWLFKSDAIVTAGHCVYNSSRGGWASRITFYPGRNGNTAPYGSAYSISMGTPTPWINNSDNTMDYGLVKLNRTIGSSTGWFGYGYNQTSVGTKVRISGYPGEKSQTQWAMNGNIFAQSEHRMWYTIDTTGGQSGSPIYLPTYTAVGVHTTGRTTWNGGKRIHEDMFNWMKSF